MSSSRKYFGIIGKKLQSLAKAELVSLFKTYQAISIQYNHLSSVVRAEGSEELERIANRAVLTKHFAEQIEEDEYEKRFHGKTFSCILLGKSKKIVLEVLVKKIKERAGAKVCLDNPDFHVIVHPNENLVGIKIGPQRINWLSKRPYFRNFFHPSALDPRLCRIMVNLARVRENDLILDPFCGTGGILLEAQRMGIRTIGLDVVKKMCGGAKKNGVEEVVQCDSLKMPIKKLSSHAIVTDIPYGISTHLSYNILSHKLVSDLISRKIYAVKRIVVMCKDSDLEKISDSKVGCETYCYRQHKNLTRCIVVT
jgi:putative methyltransferase (TIGR01177 family)